MTTSSRTATANSKRPSIRRKPSSENTRGFDDNPAVFTPSTTTGRTLIKRVRNDDARFRLITRGRSILVACSGGPDSVALLHILLSLRTKLDLGLGVVHVNYRLRKRDADLDEEYVRSICRDYSLPCFVSRPRIVSGNEEVLRDIRYRYFDRIRKREGFDTVAVAHTEDDQAETVLIRLLRGTGPEGLAGMRPERSGVIRPLLGVSKRELLEFLNAENVLFRTDSTNSDPRILRNRIRHELLPLLEAKYRPGVRSVLARTALIFQERAVSADIPSLHTAPLPNGLSFSKSAYLQFPTDVQTQELRRLYRIVSGTDRNPPASFVREADKLIRSTKSRAGIYGSSRLKITTRGDRVAMIRP